MRLVWVGFRLQLKMRSRSAFDGILGVIYPMFFATTIFLLYRQTASPAELVGVSVGSAAMGVWSATSTTAAGVLQHERRDGTLELLVAAPTFFPLVVVPITLSMATIGLYSLVVTLVWGRIAFGIPLDFADPLAFICAALATVVAIGLVGFLQSIVCVRLRHAWAVGSALELPVWLICGFLVPLSLLPHWVRPISWVLPPTWGVYALRAAALGHPAWLDIALCLALAAVYGLLATLGAGRIVDSARARATLALS
ncbi:MAG TPA: ABC transporter permease [Jatrophihabitans sp.]